MKTGWQTKAPPIAKGTPMPKTNAYYVKRAAMDQELILEMKAEISNLKGTVNNLRQKLISRRKDICDD